MNSQHPSQSIECDYRARAFALTLLLPTRLDALITYLRALCPQLANTIERLSVNFPELATRARRASFLLLDDAVKLSEPGQIMTSNGRYRRTASVPAHVKAEDGGDE